MDHNMRIYFPNLDDAELSLFELARAAIDFGGPDCDCGKACELGVDPVCKETYLSANTCDRERIVELIRDEAEVEEFRIEVYHEEETATSTGEKEGNKSADGTD